MTTSCWTAGAEILLETARFWASRAALEEDGRYHIRRVIGPDEYHEAYRRQRLHQRDGGAGTSSGRWTWPRLLAERWPDAGQAAGAARARRHGARGWRDGGRQGWCAGVDAQSGLIEQFAGIFRARADRPRRLRVAHGADGRACSGGSEPRPRRSSSRRTWSCCWRCCRSVRSHRQGAQLRYYEPRCGHGSSLSPALHALVAARLGRLDLAARYLNRRAHRSRFTTVNSAGGVHIAAMGGLWMAVMMGFVGLKPLGEELALDPMLPEAWQALRVPAAVARTRGPCPHRCAAQGGRRDARTRRCAGDPRGRRKPDAGRRRRAGMRLLSRSAAVRRPHATALPDPAARP